MVRSEISNLLTVVVYHAKVQHVGIMVHEVAQSFEAVTARILSLSNAFSSVHRTLRIETDLAP